MFRLQFAYQPRVKTAHPFRRGLIMHTEKKAVVITGASSGIGRSSVVEMNRAGWRVFATVRKQEDYDRIMAESTGDIVPVMMDVEERSSIAPAAQNVSSRLFGARLHGLVNCAGIGVVQPVEYITAEDFQKTFEVNVFGQIAVTQAFLPYLRNARGRIVNISSIGAHIALPFGGLLNASKSAFGILSDTLRLELHTFGIRVSTVEPGAIATPAVDKTLGDIEAVIAALPPDGQAEYGEMLRNFARRAYQREKEGSSPDVVARAIYHALTAERPKIRYVVGKHARLMTALPRILPDRMLDAIRLRMLGLPTQFGGTEPTHEGRTSTAYAQRFTDVT